MKILIIVTLLVLLAGVVAACARRSASPEIVAGGVYASKGEDGVYRVSKVLAFERGVVHVRLYKNKFQSLPQLSDLSKLSLGGFGDPEGFGIGHAPIAKEGFLRDSPVLLKKDTLSAEELEGYKYYLEQMKK
jgi:hypothetical protein